MANDDRWRNDQERRYRDQDDDRRRSSHDQSYGRGSDYQGDGCIAQRGFGNDRSGYNRGGDDRNRGYGGSSSGDEDRGGFSRGGREGIGDRFGGGGAYGSDNRGGGMAGGRGSRDFGGSSEYGGDRSYRGEDRGQSGTFSGNDYSSGFYGADQGYRSEDYGSRGYGGQERGYGRGGDDRGFLERAGDAVASWFSDDDRDARQQDRRGGEWSGQSHRGRGPKDYSRSDDRIQEDICERLTHDHHVDASEIEISVSNREVTLSGTVDSREAKRRAEDIAESVSGVNHVQNNLRVQQHGLSSGMGSNQGMTSGGGLSGTAMAGGAGLTTGTTGQTRGTIGQSGTGVEVSRTEGNTGRRKTGTTT